MSCFLRDLGPYDFKLSKVWYLWYHAQHHPSLEDAYMKARTDFMSGLDRGDVYLPGSPLGFRLNVRSLVQDEDVVPDFLRCLVHVSERGALPTETSREMWSIIGDLLEYSIQRHYRAYFSVLGHIFQVLCKEQKAYYTLPEDLAAGLQPFILCTSGQAQQPKQLDSENADHMRPLIQIVQIASRRARVLLDHQRPAATYAAIPMPYAATPLPSTTALLPSTAAPPPSATTLFPSATPATTTPRSTVAPPPSAATPLPAQTTVLLPSAAVSLPPATLAASPTAAVVPPSSATASLPSAAAQIPATTYVRKPAELPRKKEKALNPGLTKVHSNDPRLSTRQILALAGVKTSRFSPFLIRQILDLPRNAGEMLFLYGPPLPLHVHMIARRSPVLHLYSNHRSSVLCHVTPFSNIDPSSPYFALLILLLLYTFTPLQMKTTARFSHLVEVSKESSTRGSNEHRNEPLGFLPRMTMHSAEAEPRANNKQR
ncbi:hypothetical protein BDN72DRAFT_197625 [Pluteus cervinus]|uniref:Uncharacterized protein n=1 Tax=Pluteus cervinus TaxID=181527 RepID=A0ACD3B6R4_9AGAR|nr:hypothetical protein BDN72DRAFT_197625 [Pluteus cervinus]